MNNIQLDQTVLPAELTKVFVRYLIEIRKLLETDTTAREIASRPGTAVSHKYKLLEYLINIVCPESTEAFEKAIDEILEELDCLRKSDAGLVLIDTNTGKSVIPLSPEMIFTPPDYIGEDGELHKSKPVLHPGISSAFGLIAYESDRKRELARRAAKPNSKDAYEHLFNPQLIAVRASELLASLGIKIDMDLPVEAIEFEFGREHISGIDHSVNLRFHRANMYSAILATKIIQKYGKSGVCSFGVVHHKKNSKQQWFVVEVKFLPDPNH